MTDLRLPATIHGEFAGSAKSFQESSSRQPLLILAALLAVYTILLKWAGLHYLPAAAGSFLVAVANNYSLNRVWTFRVERGHVGAQGWRFLVVSTASLLANLAVLHGLVTAGVDEIAAQAVAIVLVTPLNFVGNKLWSFRR